MHVFAASSQHAPFKRPQSSFFLLAAPALSVHCAVSVPAAAFFFWPDGHEGLVPHAFLSQQFALKSLPSAAAAIFSQSVEVLRLCPALHAVPFLSNAPHIALSVQQV